jgi:hypothetical protein
MSNIPATLDTAVYRKLVLQLLNSLVASGGGGSVSSSNVAVASDGVTRSALNLDSAGRLIVDIGSSIQLDNITVNTDQIEGKIDTSNALLTTIQSDVVDVSANTASIAGMQIPPYDTIELSYTGGNVTSVGYRHIGSLVATVTLTYDGSGNLIQVARS